MAVADETRNTPRAIGIAGSSSNSSSFSSLRDRFCLAGLRPPPPRSPFLPTVGRTSLDSKTTRTKSTAQPPQLSRRFARPFQLHPRSGDEYKTEQSRLSARSCPFSATRFPPSEPTFSTKPFVLLYSWQSSTNVSCLLMARRKNAS